MSIILRALKKIQNEGGRQRFPVEGPSDEESSNPLALTSAAVPQKDLPPEPSPGSDYGEHAPLAETGQAENGENMKAGGLPRLLLGAIIALGILTTGWFAHTIYFNSRGSEKPIKLEARASKPEIAQPEQGSKEQAPALPIVISEHEVAAMSASEPEPVSQLPSAIQPAPVAPPAVQPPALEQAISEEAPQKAFEPPVEPMKEMAEPPAPSVGFSDKIPAQTKEAHASPEPTENQGRPEFKINAIAWRAQEPKAVINMQRVYVGDVIEGALVKEIRRKSVLMEYQGEEFELRF